MSDLVVIADQHMGAGLRDPFSEDAALTGFLDDLRERRHASGSPRTLLLLGDLFDLTAPGGGPEAALASAASAHRGVLAAIGRLAAAGVAIEVVAGNHDAELVRPAMADRLLELVRGSAGLAPGETLPLRVHAWIFHVPGVLYAEHGHQRHDINRMPQLLEHDPLARGEELRQPLGMELARYLEELHDARVRPTLRFAGGAARATVRMSRDSRARFSAAALREQARRLQLPPQALADLASLSAVGPTAVATRVLRGLRDRSDYMLEAARSVHRTLERHGAAVPFYVFGHTHKACDVPLQDGSAAPRYLNPGTWSSLTPPDAPPVRAYLELNLAEPAAQLGQWDPAGRNDVATAAV